MGMDAVVTGASGTVGTAVIDNLVDHEEYSFTPVDVEAHPDQDTVVADVSDARELGPVLEGADAVVHLALDTNLNASVTEVGWLSALERNLRASTAVLGAAVDAGVEEVVWASSNHVVGAYETEYAPDIYYPGHGVTLDHTVPVRPDSLYGVLKAYDEALGRFCAEHHGLSVSAIRIGTIRDPDSDNPYAGAEQAVEAGDLERDSEEYERRVARTKATWQSRRDFAHLVDRCLRATAPGFDVFYGVSDNRRRWFDLEHARARVGYDPVDDGEDWTAPPSG